MALTPVLDRVVRDTLKDMMGRRAKLIEDRRNMKLKVAALDADIDQLNSEIAELEAALNG